jgi:hypothetical protein
MQILSQLDMDRIGCEYGVMHILAGTKRSLKSHKNILFFSSNFPHQVFSFASRHRVGMGGPYKNLVATSPHPSFLLLPLTKGENIQSLVVASGGGVCSSRGMEERLGKALPWFWPWCTCRAPRRGGYPTCSGGGSDDDLGGGLVMVVVASGGGPCRRWRCRVGRAGLGVSTKSFARHCPGVYSLVVAALPRPSDDPQV